MGAWADLTVNADVVEGLASTYLTDRTLGVFYPNLIDAKTTQVAKTRLRRAFSEHLYREMKAFNDGTVASREAAYLDYVAEKAAEYSQIGDRLNEVLALHWLCVWLPLKANVRREGDVFYDAYRQLEKELKGAERDFFRVLPDELAIIRANESSPKEPVITKRHVYSI